MIIKKKHIHGLLLTILSFRKGEGEQLIEHSGLLTEKIGLGAKRKLQKIRKELLAHHAEVAKEEEEIKKDLESKPEEIAREMEVLADEDLKLNSEPVLLSEIEKIESSTNYDFDLIEMIAV